MRPQPNKKDATKGAPTSSAAAAAQARVQASTSALRTAVAMASALVRPLPDADAACARAIAGKASEATSWMARTSGNSTSFQA